MDNGINLFFKLSDIFEKNHFHLYLVGGSVRDYLLKIPLVDLDCATDATPDDMSKFLPSADFSFKKLGSIRLTFEGEKFDITTFRQEDNYDDFRHPNKIIFIKDMKIDSRRRDFSINAMYLDKNLKIYDFYNGITHLNEHKLVMVGDPFLRLKEDPLRIIRAVRFSLMFDLKIDDTLKRAIKINSGYIKKLNIEKIRQDFAKLDPFLQVKKNALLNELGINL